MEDCFPHGWFSVVLEVGKNSFHLPVVPVKETVDWILDRSDSGLVKRMDLGKSTQARELRVDT